MEPGVTAEVLFSQSPGSCIWKKTEHYVVMKMSPSLPKRLVLPKSPAKKRGDHCFLQAPGPTFTLGPCR
uniref:Uncharacterized protein n=1 Tax=Sciurus vulgaris TaxID=55149 RepID=A0A8D2DPH0_SCIVU